MKFDFILFENYQLATHHWFDVELIAKMLKSQGVKVAIFDIYGRYGENADIGGIDIIHWNPTHTLPDVEWQKRSHSKVETVRKGFLLKKKQNDYLKEAKEFIENKGDNFYCGSYHNGMSRVFFNIKKPCYWWGLRSNRMKLTMKKFIFHPLMAFQILKERKAFLKNPFQRLFVSNEIIKNEHESLGVPSERIIIREERCVDSADDLALDARTKATSFLTIGMLRPEKNITKTIRAFKEAKIENAVLMLEGRSAAGYEEEIEKAIDSDSRIQRNNKFLDYSDFYKAFKKSHFVVFADNKGESCITNGTMAEALINHRPIICPNYNPYKYYIEKYKVGLLYDPSDLDSFVEALKKAAALGTSYFIPDIDDFLQTIEFSNVAESLVNSLSNVKRL